MRSDRGVPGTNGLSPAGSLGELLRVALPLIISAGSLSLMHIVDRVFLTWYSTDTLAAAMPASLLHWTLLSAPIGVAFYVNTFVAQYEGSNQRDRVAASVWQGIYLSLVSGLLVGLFALLAEPIFSVIGHEPAVSRLEADYFEVLCLGSAPILLAGVLSCFYSGRGKTLVVMLVNVVTTLINAVVDYWLIFGTGPFPSMGIRGAALATVFAHIVAVALYAAIIAWSREGRAYGFGREFAYRRDLTMRLIRYGLPSGLMSFVEVSGFSIFILLVGTLGKRELAATNVAFNLNSLAFVPMLGLGTAVMTLVGMRIGEGRAELAVRTTWKAFGLAGGYMLCCGALFVLAPELVLAPYTMYAQSGDIAAISNQVVILLRFVALYSFFDAMVIVFSGAVRGAGDTQFPMRFMFAAVSLFLVVPTFVAWMTFGGNLMVSWIICTIYVMVAGIGFLMRFQTGEWKTMRVIENPVPAEPKPGTVDGHIISIVDRVPPAPSTASESEPDERRVAAS